MQSPHDLLGKECLVALLGDVGTLDREREVATDAQHIDLWFSPDAARSDELHTRGWLGRAGDRECGIELYSDTPTPGEVRECTRKHWAHQHLRELAAQASDPPTKVPLARSWIVSTGLPKTAVQALHARPRRPWPPGFLLTHDELGVGFIVLSRLPITRDTLALRMLARGPTLARACDDIARLPPGAWEHRLVDILLRWRVRIPIDRALRSPDQELFMQTTDTLYEDILRRARDEGIEKGIERGIERGIEKGLSPLVRQFSRRLARPLTQAERGTLVARMSTHGSDRLGDVVLDLDPGALERWLHDPDAR